eukprot:1158063-Pelagomonas_calceolata.AAC.12
MHLFELTSAWVQHALPQPQQQGSREGLPDTVCQSLPLSTQQAGGQGHILQQHKAQPPQIHMQLGPTQMTHGKQEWEDEGLLPQSKRQRASSSPTIKPAGAFSPEGASGGGGGAATAAAAAATASVNGGTAASMSLGVEGTSGAGSALAAAAVDGRDGKGSMAERERAGSREQGTVAAGVEAARVVGPRESPYAAGSGAGPVTPVMLILMGLNGSGGWGW